MPRKPKTTKVPQPAAETAAPSTSAKKCVAKDLGHPACKCPVCEDLRSRIN